MALRWEDCPEALPSGTVLDNKYEIREILGQGGFGITYGAFDRMMERAVAVKEFFPAMLASRQGRLRVACTAGNSESPFLHERESFLKEARTISRFADIPGIVSVYSCFEENGTAYYVMEYLHGPNLRTWVRNRGGRVSWPDAVSILSPVMDALAAVHAKGIIHRDIKPSNIILTEKGAKLIDFGSARASMGNRTLSMSIMLTPGFAPLEQYTRHGRQGPYTDIYSLGATFYYLITGTAPQSCLDRVNGSPLIPPSGFGVEIPAAAEKALLHALALKAEDRCQDMAQLKTAVFSEITAEPGNNSRSRQTPAGKQTDPAIPVRYSSTVPDSRDTVEKSERKSGRVIAALTVPALLLIAALAAVFLTSGTGSRRRPEVSDNSAADFEAAPESAFEPAFQEESSREEEPAVQTAPESGSAAETGLKPGLAELTPADNSADGSGDAEQNTAPGSRMMSDPADPVEGGFTAHCPVFGSSYLREEISSVTISDSIHEAPSDAWDISAAGDRSVLAWVVPDNDAESYNTLYKLYIAGNGGVLPPEDCTELFSGYTHMKSIDFPDSFVTSDVTATGWMFSDCCALESLDVTGFDTSHVTCMDGMFYDCSSLTDLDVGSFDTSGVTDMKYMFGQCRSLTSLDVSGFDTSSVTDMADMFGQCESLASLDLSTFDTAKVTNMNSMFSRCSALKSLNLNGFDTSKVTDMMWMFSWCSSLESLDLSSFNTSNVTVMNCMFLECSSLSVLDVSGFDTGSLTDMSAMFNGCEGEIIGREKFPDA